jgi:hypothetical protein
MVKIFQDFALLEDPIEARGRGINDTFTVKEAQKAIKTYWGNIGERKLFVATLALLDDLFKKSSTNPKQVVLRVVNINNPEIIEAEWMPNAGLPLAKDSSNNNVSYFVINQTTYSGDHGLRHGSKTEAITARIGKIGSGHYVYFFATKFTFGKPGGTGNTTGTPGLKVPPQGG